MCILKDEPRSPQGGSQKLPELTLHPLHRDEQACIGISPMQHSFAWKALVRDRKECEAGNVGREAMLATGYAGLDDLVVGISDGSLTVTQATDDETVVLVSIGLLFLEIDFGFEPVSGCAVLVVTDTLTMTSLTNTLRSRQSGVVQEFYNTWIFRCEAEDHKPFSTTQLHKTIAVLGNLGAVRPSLEHDFIVRHDAQGHFGIRRASSRRVARSSLQDVCDQGFVVKSVDARGTHTHSDDKICGRREVSMLLAAQGHPNVLRFFGLYVDPVHGTRSGHSAGSWAIVLEYCSGGSLHDALALGSFSEEKTRGYVGGIASALHHIHTQGVVHRDVQPDSVLLHPCGRPVLSKFGSAARVTDRAEMTKRCGSPSYVAPEVWMAREEACGTKMDTFALGVLTYVCVTGEAPFHGSSVVSLSKRITRCQLENGPLRHLSGVCRSFLDGLIHRSSRERMSAASALNHPWIVDSQRRASIAAHGVPQTGVQEDDYTMPVRRRRASRLTTTTVLDVDASQNTKTMRLMMRTMQKRASTVSAMDRDAASLLSAAGTPRDQGSRRSSRVEDASHADDENRDAAEPHRLSQLLELLPNEPLASPRSASPSPSAIFSDLEETTTGTLSPRSPTSAGLPDAQPGRILLNAQADDASQSASTHAPLTLPSSIAVRPNGEANHLTLPCKRSSASSKASEDTEEPCSDAVHMSEISNVSQTAAHERNQEEERRTQEHVQESGQPLVVDAAKAQEALEASVAEQKEPHAEANAMRQHATFGARSSFETEGTDARTFLSLDGLVVSSPRQRSKSAQGSSRHSSIRFSDHAEEVDVGSFVEHMGMAGDADISGSLDAQVHDDDDPETTVRQELERMKLAELKRLARDLGMSRHELEDVDEHDEPKLTLIQQILNLTSEADIADMLRHKSYSKGSHSSARHGRRRSELHRGKSGSQEPSNAGSRSESANPNAVDKQQVDEKSNRPSFCLALPDADSHAPSGRSSSRRKTLGPCTGVGDDDVKFGSERHHHDKSAAHHKARSPRRHREEDEGRSASKHKERRHLHKKHSRSANEDGEDHGQSASVSRHAKSRQSSRRPTIKLQATDDNVQSTYGEQPLASRLPAAGSEVTVPQPPKEPRSHHAHRRRHHVPSQPHSVDELPQWRSHD